MGAALQLGLFAGGQPQLGGFAHAQRLELGRGAWVEHVPDALLGHQALFDTLRGTTAWASQRRRMYDRVVDVPRLLGRLDALPHPVAELQQSLRRRTGWELDRVTAALYRDGRDSVAWHGDRLGELRGWCVMAILSVGAPRRFLLRPVGGGPSRCLPLRGGDLVILGGTIHDTFEHCVPKERFAGPRIAVMFRPSRAPAGHGGAATLSSLPPASW